MWLVGRRSGEYDVVLDRLSVDVRRSCRTDDVVYRITNAIWSDYATMAVRTGGKGGGGLTLLVVPLKGEGVDMRRLRVTGSKTGGTTFIELEDVKVPVENIIGEEGKGMFYVMNNLWVLPVLEVDTGTDYRQQPRATTDRHWSRPPSACSSVISNGVCNEARSLWKGAG